MTTDPFTTAARALGADPAEVRESMRNATEHAERNGMPDEEFALWIWHAGAVWARGMEAARAAQDPTDADALTERIAVAIDPDARDFAVDFPEVWEDTMALAARVLPIVAEEVRKAKAEALRGAAEMIEDMRNSAQIAEVAAYVPGEVGRQSVIDSFDAAMEEPGDWLRSLADSGEADTYREDRVDDWLAETWDEAHEIGWLNADEYWRTTGLIPSYSKADTTPNPHRETGGSDEHR